MIGASCEGIDKGIRTMLCKIQKRWLLGLPRDAKAGQMAKRGDAEGVDGEKGMEEEQLMGTGGDQQQFPCAWSHGM